MLLQTSNYIRISNSSVGSYNITNEEMPHNILKSTIRTITTSILIGASSIGYTPSGTINLDTASTNTSAVEVHSKDKPNLNIQSFYKNDNNETIVYTNEKLGVEDLSERVTQSQLNEIKDHFDTKLKLVEKNIEQKIDETKHDILASIKEGKNSVLNKWWVVAAFFGSAIIGPLIVEFFKQLLFQTP